ncbi:MAG: class E sortase [Actinomycetota bacterium]
MEIKSFFKRNKRKIIRYGGIALIIAGLVILIWPFYINFVMVKREADILASWDENLVSTETGDNEENGQKTGGETGLFDPEQKLPFKISIPEIDMEWMVNEGTDFKTLKEGPGFFTGSAFPGETGTCVVAGHRTTYGAPFSRLDELEEGDEIIIETTGNEEFTYIVTGQEAVLPTDLSVLENTDYPSLVLSTCTPRYFATRRLIIFARIAGQLSD